MPERGPFSDEWIEKTNYLNTGLSQLEVSTSRRQYGQNIFSTSKRQSEWSKIISKFLQPFNALLVIAAVLSFLLYFINRDRSDLYLGICIFTVSVLNTLLEYFQERSTAAILESFKNLVPPECLVFRDGGLRSVCVREIVKGDLVSLKMGDRVGADVQLIESFDIKVDESSLTGETDPIQKLAVIINSNKDLFNMFQENSSSNSLKETQSNNCLSKNKNGELAKSIDSKNLTLAQADLNIYVKDNENTEQKTNLSHEHEKVMGENGDSNFTNETEKNQKNTSPLKKHTSIDFNATNCTNKDLNGKDLLEDAKKETRSGLIIKENDRDNNMAKNREYNNLLDSIDHEPIEKLSNNISNKFKNNNTNSLENTSKILLENDNEGENNNDNFTNINMIYSGSFILNGSAKGIVTAVGDKTALGKIAHMAITNKACKSELTEDIEQYVKKLTFVALITSFIFYLIAIKNGFKMQDNLIFCVGIFIAFVPQGLPGAVTILMTIAVRRMAKKHVMVKDLKAVETLGSISLLATDKTGTLTQGKMKCVQFWDGINNFNLSQSEKLYNGNVIQALKCCSTIKIMDNGKIMGDPTEMALYNFYSKIKMDDEININLPFNANAFFKVYEVPFNSELKYQLCVVNENENFKIILKGAPDVLIEYCNTFYDHKDIQEISGQFISSYLKTYEQFASQGQRVIAVIEKIINKKDAAEFHNKINNFKHKDIQYGFCLKDFTFLGMIGIIDPPKNGVKDAIMKLRIAGIQVIMITGDHPLTAEYIARQVYILSETPTNNILSKINELESSSGSLIICGDTLEHLTETEWDNILLKKEIVFARTSPKQKLLIVKKFQAKGHIVGVSGDGVNDSPALKKAHLGISMNKTGNEVSKEAASMILMDDNFPSIVVGVMEGRKIFTNLKKCIRYILSHITSQIVPFLLYVSLGMPSPMSSILLMFIDLFTESLPAIFLAFEPTEGNIMIELPRKLPKNKTLDTNFSLFTQFRKLMKKLTNSKTGESICDINLLCWAYFEAGILIALGALGAFFATLYKEGVPIFYFTKSSQLYFKRNANVLIAQNGTSINHLDQLEILYKAQSAYFFSILIGQAFNNITCKRKNILFSKRTFVNMLPIYGSLFSLFLGYIILTTSFLNKVLLSRPVDISVFIFPIFTGFLLLFWDYIRKKMQRRFSIFRKGDADVIYRLKRSRLVDQR
ncbi:hypothetical protein COBT_000723 [Conglomerata obtusa]